MLATGIGVSKGMISQAESPKYNTKYNFSHINEIARYLLFAAGFPPAETLVSRAYDSAAHTECTAARRFGSRRRCPDRP